MKTNKQKIKELYSAIEKLEKKIESFSIRLWEAENPAEFMVGDKVTVLSRRDKAFCEEGIVIRRKAEIKNNFHFWEYLIWVESPEPGFEIEVGSPTEILRLKSKTK